MTAPKSVRLDPNRRRTRGRAKASLSDSDRTRLEAAAFRVRVAEGELRMKRDQLDWVIIDVLGYKRTGSKQTVAEAVGTHGSSIQRIMKSWRDGRMSGPDGMIDRKRRIHQ